MTIKAIETEYKGYRFRSRLEARWAVFFDAMAAIPHLGKFFSLFYEMQGYDLGEYYYLPDFASPDGIFFFEVKPGPPSIEEQRKAQLLADQADGCVCVLTGDPWYTTPLYLFVSEHKKPDVAYWAICPKCQCVGFVFDAKPQLVCSYCDGSPELSEQEWTQACQHGFLMSAYRAARSARFEHGEMPRI